ncbi:hypothetical protein Tco_1259353 [Tanacetum coccineum]
MSQNKLKQKEKGVELKNVEDIEKPRPTLTRSLLTLKPLPKIDPKAKGKGMIEEEDESDTESEDINEAEKKFKMLANDEEMARKVQEEWEAEEERKIRFLLRNFKKKREKSSPYKREPSCFMIPLLHKGDLLLNKDLRVKKGLIKLDSAIGSVRYERLIKILNKESLLKYPIIEWKSEHLGIKPQFDETKDLEEINLNVVIRSNGQRRYFSTLMRMLSIFDIEDLSVYKLVMDRYQDKIPAVFDRVLLGRFMIMFIQVDEGWNFGTQSGLECYSKLEVTWFFRELAIPEQTTTGKGTSNPLMAGSLPKTTKPA